MHYADHPATFDFSEVLRMAEIHHEAEVEP
jgi:hypothetical protein